MLMLAYFNVERAGSPTEITRFQAQRVLIETGCNSPGGDKLVSVVDVRY